MLTDLKGIHHVTTMAADANVNNTFYTGTLGLRRVKKTVNFDAPDVYHLYYGDAAGTPGTIMTYFPFPHIRRGRPGTGEVGTTMFTVPEGALEAWQERLEAAGVTGLSRDTAFGEKRLHFSGPDGDGLALVERADDGRAPWTAGGLGADIAIRGFRGATLRLADDAATAELLTFMGYRETGREGAVRRFLVENGNGADIIDIETRPDMAAAAQGAGSVHHIAFAVADRAAQLKAREALTEAGYPITPVIDRDYFWAIYFRTPGGVLFEIATNEPGFARDEAPEHLGEALKLPAQHEHLRATLERSLDPITD
ncbi:MAG TPA: ring-cleaving dioxygenase [Pararhizobium sp.]|nr:ring-cleaving dioxygenase [Pararhizobium sp.]